MSKTEQSQSGKAMTELQSLLEGKSLLIFDFDGTIADTSQLHNAAFRLVLSPMGVEVDYFSIAGLKTLDAIRKCLSDAGYEYSEDELMEFVLCKQRAVRDMISEGLCVLPGVAEFLHWAQPRYRLSLVTSGSRGTVELALRKLGYSDWFDPLICADDVLNSKPNPEGFNSVLQITATKAADAVVFEDSAAGFAAARASGVALVDARKNLWEQLVGTGSSV
jgi:HAD superfamily hydrolase (TIGR01509 family)